MLIRGNLRTNVTHEFGSLDVEATILAPGNSAQNPRISFDPELSFKKQIDVVVKNCNGQIRNIAMCYQEIFGLKVFACIGSLNCDI